jgi:hypothetical protein
MMENLPWIIGTTLLSFLGIVILVVVVLCLLPSDYFMHDRQSLTRFWASPFALVSFLARNLLAIVLIVGGLILVLPIFPLPPGSGFLVSAVGLIISDIPGRKRLLLVIVRPRKVINTINWMRRKFGCTELELPPRIQVRQMPEGTAASNAFENRITSANAVRDELVTRKPVSGDSAIPPAD